MDSITLGNGDVIDVAKVSVDTNNGEQKRINTLIPIMVGSTATKDTLVDAITTHGISEVNINGEEIEIEGNFKSVTDAKLVEGDENGFYLGEDEEGHELRASATVSITVLSDDIALEEIDSCKASKVAELSKICHDSISEGVDVELPTAHTTEHFSYDDDDRSNIKEMFDAVVMGADAYPYHKDGGDCKSYDKADIIAIYSAVVTNKVHHTTYYNQLKHYVNALDNITDVCGTVYGQALTGEYKDVYDANIAEARRQLEKIISNIDSVG